MDHDKYWMPRNTSVLETSRFLGGLPGQIYKIRIGSSAWGASSTGTIPSRNRDGDELGRQVGDRSTSDSGSSRVRGASLLYAAQCGRRNTIPVALRGIEFGAERAQHSHVAHLYDFDL